MEIIRGFFLALMGAAFGSFLNVCIDRIPAGKSIAYPPSHCDNCGHPLSTKDLFPVFSYLLLKGRCRYCKASIPKRVVLVELGTAILVVSLYIYLGFTLQFAVAAVYCILLGLIALIDLYHKIIPNVITYPAAVLILIADIFLPQPGLSSALIGAGAGALFFLVVLLIYPNGMGMGDVKLAFVMGLMLGWKLMIVAVWLGCVVGGIIAVSLVLSKKKNRKDVMAFGTFLSAGAIIALLFGEQIIAWYLSLPGLGT